MSLGPSDARKRDKLLVDPIAAQPPDSGVRARCDSPPDEAEVLDFSDLVVEYEVAVPDLTAEPLPSREPRPSTSMQWANEEATMRYLVEPEILLARCRHREARQQAASRSLPPPTPRPPPPAPRLPPPVRPRASLQQELAAVEADLFPVSEPVRSRPPDRSRPLILATAVVLALIVLAASVWLRTANVL